MQRFFVYSAIDSQTAGPNGLESGGQMYKSPYDEHGLGAVDLKRHITLVNEQKHPSEVPLKLPVEHPIKHPSRVIIICPVVLTV